MIKISYERDAQTHSNRNTGIGKIIFCIIHMISILGVIVGACLINITHKVLEICAIVCVIFTVIGAFVYSDYDD